MTSGIFATRARGRSEAGAAKLHTRAGTGVALRTEDGGARAGVKDDGGSQAVTSHGSNRREGVYGAYSLKSR